MPDVVGLIRVLTNDRSRAALPWFIAALLFASAHAVRPVAAQQDGPGIVSLAAQEDTFVIRYAHGAEPGDLVGPFGSVRFLLVSEEDSRGESHIVFVKFRVPPHLRGVDASSAYLRAFVDGCDLGSVSATGDVALDVYRADSAWREDALTSHAIPAIHDWQDYALYELDAEQSMQELRWKLDRVAATLTQTAHVSFAIRIDDIFSRESSCVLTSRDSGRAMSLVLAGPAISSRAYLPSVSRGQ